MRYLNIEKLMALNEARLKEPTTKEAAHKRLMEAGILDMNGNHTEHYPEMAKFFNENPLKRENV